MWMDYAALLSLVPAALLLIRPRTQRDGVTWSLLLVTVVGPASLVAVQNAGGWQPSLSGAIWVSVAASMMLFAVIVALNESAWRLLPLLAGYCLLLGLVATLFGAVPRENPPAAASPAWLDLHIAMSVATYGLATIAAVADFAGWLQERALKRRRSTAFLQSLPAVADGERLLRGLLGAAEIVLGIGVVSGMATQYLMSGRLLVFDHKTTFSLLAFVVIGALLLLHWRTGLRGRRATGFVLTAYVLLTLAYPGVKFVRDVLLS
jgi:ABC-type uncharacterized transport system permease subunit